MIRLLHEFTWIYFHPVETGFKSGKRKAEFQRVKTKPTSTTMTTTTTTTTTACFLLAFSTIWTHSSCCYNYSSLYTVDIAKVTDWICWMPRHRILYCTYQSVSCYVWWYLSPFILASLVISLYDIFYIIIPLFHDILWNEWGELNYPSKRQSKPISKFKSKRVDKHNTTFFPFKKAS